MPKYSKVYLRNKKESNVSIPLRFSFLKSIFVDGMSVKNVSPTLTKAALKWKMHYSTAKIIARLARRSKESEFFHQLSLEPVPSIECGWKAIDNSIKKACINSLGSQ